MSEAVFSVFNKILDLLNGLLYAGCLAMLFHPFIRERRRRRLAAVFGVYLLVFLLGNIIMFPPNGSILLVVVLLLALSGRLGLERSLTFLLAAFYYCAKTSGGLILGTAHYMVSEAFYPDTLEISYLFSALLLAALLLSHNVALAAMVYAIRRQLLRRPLDLHPKTLCYLSLIPVTGILFGTLIASILYEIQDGVYLQLYQRHPLFLALVPLMAALFYAGAYIAVAFHQEMAALAEEKETWFVERQQVRAIRERMEEVERFYSRIREIKHDLRSHLTNIKGLAQGGCYEDMEAYIAGLDGSIGELELSARTGNAVTDVIVSDKQKEAARLGVAFHMDFRYPGSGGYNAYEIGVILHNLLQNALEASKKAENGYVFLTGRQKKKFYLIEVKNSFSGEVTFDRRTGLPVTSKTEDRGFHGLGLSNVRREVEKYMGDMEVKAENGEFCITVLLQEKADDTFS